MKLPDPTEQATVLWSTLRLACPEAQPFRRPPVE